MQQQPEAGQATVATRADPYLTLLLNVVLLFTGRALELFIFHSPDSKL